MSGGSAAAMRAVELEHSELRQGLRERVASVLASAKSGEGLAETAGELMSFFGSELLPHASAEEATIYAVGAGHKATRLLTQVMLDEHRWLETLVHEYQLVQNDPIRGAAKAEAIAAMFDMHSANEERYLLPEVFRLSDDPEALVAQVQEGVDAVIDSFGSETPADAVAHWFG